MVYDEDDRIVFFNPAAPEILGVSEESLLQRRAHVGAARRRGAACSTTRSARWRSRACTGEPLRGRGHRPAHRDRRPALDDRPTRALHGEPADIGRYAVVGVHGHHRAAGGAAGARGPNAELAQFAYVASHDLSEPLRMVASYLQRCAAGIHGQMDEDADEFIDFAVEGGTRMRAGIEDLPPTRAPAAAPSRARSTSGT